MNWNGYDIPDDHMDIMSDMPRARDVESQNHFIVLALRRGLPSDAMKSAKALYRIKCKDENI